MQFKNSTPTTKIGDELPWTQKRFMFESNLWDTNSMCFLHIILKRSVPTISMNCEFLRTISELSWQIIPLDLIQGKYPVIKPSIWSLDLSNALLGRGNMIICQGMEHKWLERYSWGLCFRYLVRTQSCVTSQDYNSINYLWDWPFLVAFSRQQKSQEQAPAAGKFESYNWP